MTRQQRFLICLSLQMAFIAIMLGIRTDDNSLLVMMLLGSSGVTLFFGLPKSPEE
jgi:hypothetical protein